MLRLAYIGVPAVFGQDLYRYLEKNGARVVYNEIQRQFAMPRPGDSLAEQYCNYTYPYSIDRRVEDIAEQIEQRRVDGIIHYVQAFCHRGIGEIIFRAELISSSPSTPERGLKPLSTYSSAVNSGRRYPETAIDVSLL